VGFFWGMLTMIVALVMLSHQPETLVCLGITLVSTVLAVAAIIVDRGSAKDTA
jgi:hypothetical protein